VITGKFDTALTLLPVNLLQGMTQTLSPFTLPVAGTDNYEYLRTDLSIS